MKRVLQKPCIYVFIVVNTFDVCNTRLITEHLLQLPSCTRVLLLLPRPQRPNPLLHRTKTWADLREETTWSPAAMVLRVYWHPWVSSSTSPSTLSPRTRCINTARSTGGAKNRHIDTFEMLNVPSFIHRLCRTL